MYSEIRFPSNSVFVPCRVEKLLVVWKVNFSGYYFKFQYKGCINPISRFVELYNGSFNILVILCTVESLIVLLPKKTTTTGKYRFDSWQVCIQDLGATVSGGFLNKLDQELLKAVAKGRREHVSDVQNAFVMSIWRHSLHRQMINIKITKHQYWILLLIPSLALNSVLTRQIYKQNALRMKTVIFL